MLQQVTSKHLLLVAPLSANSPHLFLSADPHGSDRAAAASASSASVHAAGRRSFPL